MPRSKNQCNKCYRSFDTPRGLSQHQTKAHPYVAPKPKPVEHHRLSGGLDLVLGKKVKLTKEGTIIKITKSRYSDVAEVDIEIESDNWGRSNN